MLNPSTADHLTDDPTIRRLYGFARREQFGSLLVANLFPLRATSPAALFAHHYPHGIITTYTRGRSLDDAPSCFARGERKNKPLIREAASQYRYWNIVHTWKDSRFVCLGINQDGSPRHPLYVAGDVPFQAYPSQIGDKSRKVS